MEQWIERFSHYCADSGIITQKDIPWFRYGLEKRIFTLVGAVPFFLLALFLTDISTAVPFFFSFYLLRRYANGYHAKSMGVCFVQSLLFESVFLGLVGRFLNLPTALTVATVSALLIAVLAPFNHPNMHLSDKEICACRVRSRFYAGCLLGCTYISAAVQKTNWVKGFALGIAMAAFLLCLAYFINGGNHNEHCTGKDQECCH